MKKSIAAAIGGGIAAVIVIAIALYPMSSHPSIPAEPTQASKIRVIASFYPLYEFTKNVGGNRVDVSVLVPIGVEPHDWEPSTSDLLSLKDASVFVYNGNMETFVEKLTDSDEFNNVNFVDTSSGLDLLANAEGQSHFAYDPHIWLDPVLAEHQVNVIKDALIKADPTDSAYFEENANAYNDKLVSLDEKIKSELGGCGKDTFVSFHNAFSYFAKRYGIKSVPLTGISPEAEPTPAELKDFVDYVRANDIKVIFAEDLVNPRLAEVLADEAGAQVMILSPIEGLSDGDLKAGKTYLDKMQENLDLLKIALECK